MRLQNIGPIGPTMLKTFGASGLYPSELELALTVSSTHAPPVQPPPLIKSALGYGFQMLTTMMKNVSM